MRRPASPRCEASQSVVTSASNYFCFLIIFAIGDSTFL